MSRSLVAAALLAVLTILGVLDLLEDTGLIHYSTTEMDKTVEDALDNYGEAIRSAADVLAYPVKLQPHGLGYYLSSSQDLISSHITHVIKRKRNLDFAGSAFDPLKYSQVFVV
jgi:hypothetical protein